MCDCYGMTDINGTVVGIQGRDVDSAAPNDGDVYRWDAGTSKWVPVAPPQPLEPWVGTVNTQAQVIKRIPWTCRITSTTPVSTGVSVTIPTDKAVGMSIQWAYRLASSPAGVVLKQSFLSIANNGGTLTAVPDVTNSATNTSGSLSSTNGGTVILTTSGTTVTLEVVFSSAVGNPTVDCQGFVDLILV